MTSPSLPLRRSTPRYRLNWLKVGAFGFCLGFWALAVAFGIFLTSAR